MAGRHLKQQQWWVVLLLDVTSQLDTVVHAAMFCLLHIIILKAVLLDLLNLLFPT